MNPIPELTPHLKQLRLSGMMSSCGRFRKSVGSEDCRDGVTTIGFREHTWFGRPPPLH